MKTKFSSCLTLFGISLFVGFVLVAVAGGALFPSLLRISAPVVCHGTFQIESHSYSQPGQYSVTHQVFCTDTGDGTRKEITIAAILVSGLLYSVGIFIMILINNAIRSVARKVLR